MARLDVEKENTHREEHSIEMQGGYEKKVTIHVTNQEVITNQDADESPKVIMQGKGSLFFP